MFETGRRSLAMVAALLVLAVVSALVLVYNSYLNRQLFISLSNTSHQYNDLRVEFGRLQLEYGTWTSPAFIEKVAAEKLQMRLPASGQVVLVPGIDDDTGDKALRFAASGRSGGGQ